MISLLVVLTPIALMYSIAILPSGIASISASMTTQKPYLTAAAFIVGKFLPSFLFGLAVVVGLDAAFGQIASWSSEVWRNPNWPLIGLQLVIGCVMVVFGYRLSRISPETEKTTSGIPLTPKGFFTLGAGLTIISLPANLLYFAAIDLILRAELGIPGILTAVIYYNVLLLSPLILIVLSRWLFSERADRLVQRISAFLQKRGRKLLFFGMLGLGILLIVDAIGWFVGLSVLPEFIR